MSRIPGSARRIAQSTRYALGAAAVVAILSLSSACQRAPAPKPDPEAPAVPAAPWAAQPPSDWPQIVLTNAATFRGHTPLNGASCFLVQAPHGEVVMATARHLIGNEGGVEPEVTVEQFQQEFESWRVFPRTKPSLAASISGLIAPVISRYNFDWLALSLKNTQSLPASPLRLRPNPVAVGEEVFLIGVPYSEPDRLQNVYRGKVTERKLEDRFKYTIDPPVDIRGFSGAPIVDHEGRVVGVMTVWFKPQKQGEKYLEAGGEDAATIWPALRDK